MARSRFRSGLERRIARQLEGEGVGFDYESFKIPFIQPQKLRRYTPDFILPSAIIIEAKGRWSTKDRQKFQMISETYPDLDVRFVFSRSSQTISKRSSTTYADYCESNGWLFAEKRVPLAWLEEPLNEASARTINRILKAKINQ